MSSLTFFCLTLEPSHKDLIKKFGYSPVGLGTKQFSNDFFSDSTGDNITNKNPFYGEYTFHYWIWKNYLQNIKTDWVGFCQYRKFFVTDNQANNNITYDHLSQIVLKNIPKSCESYESILGNPFFVNKYKLVKTLKNHFVPILRSPQAIFDKTKRTIKLHFDMMHGTGNLDRAIDLLDVEDKENFKNYVNQNVSFHPHNMFVCRTNVLRKYYENIFNWLFKCEKIFGFKDLDGYGLKRIYGFLAERYLSYWFTKNTKHYTFPILVKDLTDYL